MKTHNPVPFECDLCGMSFKNKDSMRVHMYFHNPESSMFECEICGKTYTWEVSLRAHMKTHDPESPMFECEICGKLFTNKSDRTKHLKLHDPESPMFPCELCGKLFKTKAYLKVHMKLHDSQSPMFECDLCGKLSKTKVYLKVHMSIHNLEPPMFECDLCGKSFNAKLKVKRHMFIHNPEPPMFECDLCGSLLKHKHCVRLHMLLHGVKFFECPHCPAEFVTKCRLKRHLKVHVECPLCAKFLFRRQLKTHVTKIHKTIVPSKEKCIFCKHGEYHSHVATSTDNENVQELACHYCGFVTTGNKNSLFSHVRYCCKKNDVRKLAIAFLNNPDHTPKFVSQDIQSVRAIFTFLPFYKYSEGQYSIKMNKMMCVKRNQIAFISKKRLQTTVVFSLLPDRETADYFELNSHYNRRIFLQVAPTEIPYVYQQIVRIRDEFNWWIRNGYAHDENELQLGHMCSRDFGGSDLIPFISLQTMLANLIIAYIEAFLRKLLKLGFKNFVIRTSPLFKDNFPDEGYLSHNNPSATIKIKIGENEYDIPYATTIFVSAIDKNGKIYTFGWLVEQFGNTHNFVYNRADLQLSAVELWKIVSEFCCDIELTASWANEEFAVVAPVENADYFNHFGGKEASYRNRKYDIQDPTQGLFPIGKKL